MSKYTEDSGYMEDLKLIDQTLKGDNESFRKLVKKYEKMVWCICSKYLGERGYKNYHNIKLTAQNTFIRIYKYLKTFKEESKFSTWFYTIAIRVCKDRIEELGKEEKEQAYSINEPILTEDAEINRQIPDYDPEVEEAWINKEKSRKLNEVLKSLKEEHREVIELVRQGHSYKEIAKKIDKPIGTVKSRINRAIRKAQEILKERGVL